MDRKFERVFEETLGADRNDLYLTRELREYFGYFDPETILESDQQKRVLKESVWNRHQLYRLDEKRRELAKLLFESSARHKVNLVPHLSKALNALMPDKYAELEPVHHLSEQSVELLDVFYVWRGTAAEPILLHILQSALTMERTSLSEVRPDMEEDLYRWFIKLLGVRDVTEFYFS